jgi:hypothetical protein
MSKRTNRSNSPTIKYGMVNVEFTPKEKGEIGVYLHGLDIQIADLILMATDSSHKISFSRDDYHECYVCSITDKRSITNRKENPVYLLRHADLDKLFGIAWWFFVEALQRGENAFASEANVYDW